MKSYPITLECNYAMWDLIIKKEGVTDTYFAKKLKRTVNLQDKIDFCNKWIGQTLTLVEVETHIKELGAIEFNGEEIMILNDDD